MNTHHYVIANLPAQRLASLWGRLVHFSALKKLLATGIFVLGVTHAAASTTTTSNALPLTVTAQLLAGVAPNPNQLAPNAPLNRILASPEWHQHEAAAHAGDQQLRQRIARTMAWQSRHLPAAANSPTLIYPFSGPDLINAFALFPHASRYVFFSLEPVGATPDLTSLDDPALAALFGDLHVALNDLVALNFFITPNMKDHITGASLQGSVPVLLAMMGLLNWKIESIDYNLPWAEAEQNTAKGGASAVRIRFSQADSKQIQELIYVSLDVSDSALRHQVGFLPWLRSFGDSTVLLKSASYLLHGSHFRQLAQTILNQAEYIVQDDTGFPYKALLDNGYQLTLFGQYEEPVKLFQERYQADLAAAFASTPYPARLPFPFGYNWRKDGKSGLMLAHKVSHGIVSP